jgi:glycosyltransferase involved in cell wall biosynthesis
MLINPIDVASPKALNVLAIGHDASLTGAPLLLLSYLREASKKNFNMTFRALIFDGGMLSSDFSDEVETLILLNSKSPATFLSRLLQKFSQGLRDPDITNNILRKWLRLHPSPNVIYVNTVASISGLRKVKKCLSVIPPVVIHVHELEWLLLKYQDQDNIKEELQNAFKIIVPSVAVATALENTFGIAMSQIEIIHEWLCMPIKPNEYRARFRLKVRRELGLSSSDILCITVGKVQWRKGSDLMPMIAKKCTKASPLMHLAWVGTCTDDERLQQNLEKNKMGLSRLHWVNEQQDPYPYFAAADLYILPSREDPYPVAMVEAALFGLPIICFEQGGGAPEFIRSGCGIAIPYLEVDQFASAILALSSDPRKRALMGRIGVKHVLESHTVQHAEPLISRILLEASGKY